MKDPRAGGTIYFWTLGRHRTAHQAAKMSGHEDVLRLLLDYLGFSNDEIATVTPELEKACRKLVEGMLVGGPYLPAAYNRLRVQFPGNHGGVNWGGRYRSSICLNFIL